MSHILLVDDSAVARKVLSGVLINEASRITEACDGQDALDKIAEEVPDLVISDLLMPNMNGLKLVRKMKSQHPGIPVVLVTAHGSEDIAATALQEGAASYVPKHRAQTDLCPTVRRVLDLSRAKETHLRLLGRAVKNHICFELDNDPKYIPSLVHYLQECMAQMGLCDESDTTRVGVALDEALVNALFHGNLEVSSELREEANRFEDLANQRRDEEPYKSRRIFVDCLLTDVEATVAIRDEGPGFDLDSLPDPTDSANLEKASGRGIMLMHLFMDDVKYNDVGNEVVLLKRKSSAEVPAEVG